MDVRQAIVGGIVVLGLGNSKRLAERVHARIVGVESVGDGLLVKLVFEGKTFHHTFYAGGKKSSKRTDNSFAQLLTKMCTVGGSWNQKFYIAMSGKYQKLLIFVENLIRGVDSIPGTCLLFFFFLLYSYDLILNHM
jgi:hypothetical protein